MLYVVGKKPEEAEYLRQLIHKESPHHKQSSVLIFISLASRSETFGRHQDRYDVYYIQAQGKTRYIIEEDEKEFEYILEPGDMLYIPQGVFHTPIPLTPRAALSIGFDRKYGIKSENE